MAQAALSTPLDRRPAVVYPTLMPDRLAKRTAALLIAAALMPAPRHAAADITAPSGLRVDISQAQVMELACSRRRFSMEFTKSNAGWFPYMTRKTFHSGIDPQGLVMGIVSTILLVPITVLSVPTDLVAAPFRRECTFKLRMSGALVGWAGTDAPDVPVGAEARNLISKGVPEVSAPAHFSSSAETVSDDTSRFSIELGGYVGKSKDVNISWTVKGQPASQMQLSQKGDHFILHELDPGFGVGIHEMEPMTIIPTKGRPDPAAEPAPEK
ncbi:MAG: hypothetical protein ABII00_12230 [Elusimicrobiota bacterium]